MDGAGRGALRWRDKGDAMYLPKAFDASERARCHALIQAESFATLVTTDETGLPFATHLPVLLDGDRGSLGTLLAHVARPNPQWRHFGPGRPALVVFQGPHAYVSPSWYATHPSVPTWNYVAVHAYGVPRLVEEAAAVKVMLGRLVHTYEAGRPEPWTVESLPVEYVDRMIKGIVAFEIPIDRLEGKAKLSQNRSPEDQARVAAALRADGDGLSRAVADLMAS
jgi:transcriptional regulator